MENDWVDFAAVKRAVTMPMLIERYDLKLHKSGRELRGRCPIHNGEGENSFGVNTEKNVFNCFSCKAKGNVLEFVAAMERCSIRDAALQLAEWFSIGTAATTQTNNKNSNDQRAREDVVVGERSASNKPLTFRLSGIDSSHPYLVERGIDRETAEYFGAGLFSGKGSMNGRIVIPIENESGELVAYVGRSIDGSEPRYKLPTGFKKSQVLFNLARARDDSDGAVVLVEGFFDCMKVTQAELPCVALMGCSLSEAQENLLVKHFKNVWLMLDGDEAGRNAATECVTRIGRRMWVRLAEVGDDKQPDQLSSEELRKIFGPP